MRVLVTAASKHGATAGVAEAIADRLSAAGLEVERRSPEDVVDLAGIDAVVIGSAVYMTQWMDSAHQFMRRFDADLARVPVWAFSVGMAGVPKHAPQDPSRIGPALERVEAREHRTFAGRYSPSLLSLRERSIARLAGAVEGDFRDWRAIEEWADSIAECLTHSK